MNCQVFPLRIFSFVVFSEKGWIHERHLLKTHKREERSQEGKDMLYVTKCMPDKGGEHERKLINIIISITIEFVSSIPRTTMIFVWQYLTVFVCALALF